MGRNTNRSAKKRRYLIWVFFGCMAAAVVLSIQGLRGPSLMPWHSERLTAEFSSKKLNQIRTFDDYRHLEDRLFKQLADKVYGRTGTGPRYALVRYSEGSAADPRRLEPNWNRSVEIPHESPAGAALLLHGMSDSPYSLRALAETLNKHQYWIIGLRLPGHGTAPSGLKHIDWEDMAAAIRLSIAHLASKVGQKPLHLVGYSTGAPLALDFTLDALEGKASPLPASLVLISPAIGIHPAAGLAGLKNRLSVIPGLGHLAWLSIKPEFDPYKYNSFATNAGNQVHRVTRSVAGRLAAWVRDGPLDHFPPTLVLKSTIDATVSTDAVLDRLLRPLGPHGHELVLFDINRFAAKTAILVSDPGPLTTRLMTDPTLPFTLTLVTNENPESLQVITRRKGPLSAEASESKPLNLAWPAGVLSLSHVALPFPKNDPLYGQQPPDNENRIFLGQMAIQGERGLLRIPSDWLMRLRHNPFYEFLERRALEWMDNVNDR